MRAVAVLLVIVYHLTLGLFTGGFAGVDVFFVISGFLITSLMLREVARTGTVSIPRFYARRARRLLPAASLVLLVSTVIGWLILPASALANLARDVIAATFYVVNWALALASVDYLAEDNTPTAVQHYWSLSVEEQFYVVWPLLILLAVWWARRTRLSAGPIMFTLLALVSAASLVYSVQQTASDPATAYFVTTTRVWELGVGALLAFGVSWLATLPRWVATVLATVGIVAVIWAATTFAKDTPWPGSAALVPVLGTAAVIAAGCITQQTVVARVLSLRPMVFLGGLSYSLYLWHWPLVVFVDQVRPGTGWRGRFVLGLLAVTLAWATKKLLEDPVRFHPVISRSTWRALLMGAATMVVTASVALLALSTIPTLDQDRSDRAQGGSVLSPSPSGDEPPAAPTTAPRDDTAIDDLQPNPAVATEDLPALYGDDCQVPAGDPTPRRCEYGDPDGTTTVALVGDSKAGQWLPGLDVVAQDNGWKLLVYTKSGCAWNARFTTVGGEPEQSCREWGQSVLTALTGPDAADLVITSGLRSTAVPEEGDAGSKDAMLNGYHELWSTLLEQGVGVIALSDSPQPPFKVYQCVEENPDTFATECAFEANDGSGTGVLREAAQMTPGVQFLDLNPWVCPGTDCPPVIGGVLIYRQGSHITATYAESLAPVLEALLLPLADAALAEVAG